MTEEDIADFVADIIDTGCDIRAIGTSGYVIGDADLMPEHYELIRNDLIRIGKVYGERSHLKASITTYLREIGRVIHFPTVH